VRGRSGDGCFHLQWGDDDFLAIDLGDRRMEGFVGSGEFESFDLACAGLEAFRRLECAKPLRRS
jgi:hypothetical protein